VGRAFFVSAVARIMKPGCKVDTMVVLEGPQGIGKSRLIQALFGVAWHCDIVEAPGALDFYQNLRGKWIGEFSELGSLGTADQNKVKQALSGTSDTYRASYGRNSKTYPRQFIFVGNTNKKEYLHDSTGARRYLPVECESVEIDAVTPLVPQLWAEAVHRYQSGEKWWDIPGAAEEQDRRYEQDVWEEKIADWLKGRQRITVLEIMEECLGLKVDRQGKSEQHRIGKILQRLKWTKKQESSGDRRRFHFPPKANKSKT
jgi:predicted P-loop ATPase